MGSPIKAGTADVSTVIRIVDSTTGLPETTVEHDSTGIDLWYRRDVDPGGTPLAKVSITEVALTSLTAAHDPGGIEHIGDGYYRLDLPDAAFITGAIGVLIGGTVTDMLVTGNYHPIVEFDLAGTEGALLAASAAGPAIPLITGGLQTHINGGCL